MFNARRLSKNRVEVLKTFLLKTDASYETDLVDNMLQQDPPDHTRPAQTRDDGVHIGCVSRMRTRITDVAEGLLHEIERYLDRGPIDLVESYALMRERWHLSPLFEGSNPVACRADSQYDGKMQCWSRIRAAGLLTISATSAPQCRVSTRSARGIALWR